MWLWVSVCASVVGLSDMPSSIDGSRDDSDKTQLFTDSSFKIKAEDPFLTAQDRVRKWLHESSELKLPANSRTGSFLSRRGPTEVTFLTEEEAEMYPNEDGPFRFGSGRGCFGMFSCLPLKNKR